MAQRLSPNDAELFVKHLPQHLVRRSLDPDCLKPIINVSDQEEQHGYAWLKDDTYQFWTTRSVCDAILVGDIVVDFIYNEDGNPASIRLRDADSKTIPVDDDGSGCVEPDADH